MAFQEHRSDTERPRAGHLVVIGGNEDREHEMLVLRRFVELTGREDPQIVVLMASGDERDCWPLYDHAFARLGVGRRECVSLESRACANDPALARRVSGADGLFLAGADAKRLLAVLGGTRLDDAMHHAFSRLGTCIAGTSAAASALSQHLMVDAHAAAGLPHEAQALGAGLGYLQRVVIDQHFSERQRLARLLAVVAQNPGVLGIGIDEDTALVIPPDGGVEVVGDGAVTLIDGRQMSSFELRGRERALLELADVRLHLLPAGARYRPGTTRRGAGAGESKPLPPVLRDLLAVIAAPRTELTS